MELQLTESAAYLKGEKEELEEIHKEAYYGKIKDGKIVLSTSEITHLLMS